VLVLTGFLLFLGLCLYFYIFIDLLFFLCLLLFLGFILSFILYFVGHEPRLGDREIDNDGSALEDALVEVLDGFLAGPELGKLDKGEPFVEFIVIGVDWYLKIDNLSKGFEQFLEMLFPNVENKVAYDQSVPFAFVFLLF
jgi:hypothetical protein